MRGQQKSGRNDNEALDVVVPTLGGRVRRFEHARLCSYSGRSRRFDKSLDLVGNDRRIRCDLVNAIVSGFLKDLVSDATSAVSSFFESLNFITRTPKELSYQEDYVVRFEGAMRALSYGLLGVVGMVAGFNLLWRPALGMSVPGATQILPRLILGAILITTAHEPGSICPPSRSA